MSALNSFLMLSDCTLSRTSYQSERPNHNKTKKFSDGKSLPFHINNAVSHKNKIIIIMD